MISIYEGGFSEKEAKKIEEFFGNLNNYKEFFEEGQFKSNKAGTLANLRLPYNGKIITVRLIKVDEDDETKRITLYSAEIDSDVTMKISYYKNTHCFPNISVSGNVYLFEGKDIVSRILRNFVEDYDVDNKIEKKIRSKMRLLAYVQK